MRFPGLPRLPVSRRRHEEVELELRDEFDHERAVRAKLERELIQERNEAWARVAELEAAIREHLDGEAGYYYLMLVLDGHDRQEQSTHCRECGGLLNLDLGRIKHRRWCQHNPNRQERELCEHTGQPVGPNSRYGCGCHHCEP